MLFLYGPIQSLANQRTCDYLMREVRCDHQSWGPLDTLIDLAFKHLDNRKRAALTKPPNQPLAKVARTPRSAPL